MAGTGGIIPPATGSTGTALRRVAGQGVRGGAGVGRLVKAVVFRTISLAKAKAFHLIFAVARHKQQLASYSF